MILRGWQRATSGNASKTLYIYYIFSRAYTRACTVLRYILYIFIKLDNL
nr:MAG TPA: hypothetical protein [Bacteriophage sp.]